MKADGKKCEDKKFGSIAKRAPLQHFSFFWVKKFIFPKNS